MDNKALAKGIAKISLIVFALVLVGFFVLKYVLPVHAVHTSTASLEPEWSPANQIVNYTVTFCKISGDTINEVRIYKNYDGSVYYTNFQCYEKAGWELLYIGSYPACFYVANSSSPDYNPLDVNGECQNFTFSARTPPSGQQYCNLRWQFETRDVNYEWKYLYDSTSVDDVPPEITKTIRGAQWGTCPPTNGEECWITKSTKINISVNEKGVCGISGLDWCEITYTVDGGSPIREVYQDLNGETYWSYEFSFDEDSVHKLNVTCKDIAGNRVEDIETFKIDSTPPTTTKVVSEPKKVEGNVEWVDTLTTITLTAVDSDPTGHQCNVGVKGIYWADVIVDDNACSNPENYCEPQQLEYNFKEGNSVQITKNEESCHLLQYYSVDNLGNAEQVKTNCFFVDKTPPKIEKEVNQPKVEELDLEMLGKGKAHWVTSQSYSGSSSAKLVIPDNALGTDFAGVDSFFDVFVELKDITSLSYYRKVVKFDNGWSPLVILGIDADGDGKFEAKPLEWEASLSAGTVDPTLLGDDSFIQCEAETGLGAIDTDWVKVDAYKDFKCYTPNVTGNGYEVVYDYLEYFQKNTVGRVEPTDKVAMIKVELGGNPPTQDNEIAYVDYVEVNGVVRIDEPVGFTWVSPVSNIVFTCQDQQPHPSGDEKVCFKVSFDDPKNPDLTKKYCNKYGGTIGEDGFCCVAVGESHQFTFNFNTKEDSLHDLEYYCKDAVEKKSDTYIQYYKVDSQPPIIAKTMIGDDHLGKCPPLKPEDQCYVKDDGKNGVRIDVKDGGEICHVDKSECTYELWWDEQPSKPIKTGVFGEEGVDIYFTEDSQHILKVKCKDALGNEMPEDVEIFLVDSTPPVTTKTYGEPTKVEDGYRWITKDTPITLTATDEKVGVDKIYWRYSWFSNDTCKEFLTPRSGTYRFSPTDNCPVYKGYPFPSTNEWNKNGQNPYHPGEIGPHVNLVETGVGYVTLEFVNPQNYWICFEYRSDGDIGQYINHIHYSPCIDDDLYPYVCLLNNKTNKTISAVQFVEVRSMFGAERDWDFGWTKFDVILNVSGWNLVNGNTVTFNIPESSCHKIEYFAIDKLNNIEPINRQFVIVDNTPPKGIKIVGQPKIAGEGFTWVTQQTPITLDCDDSWNGEAPHPVDQETVCYKVSYDLDINGDKLPDDGGMQYLTEQYCEEFGGEYNSTTGECCAYVGKSDYVAPSVYTFHFMEDSLHNLEFYCKDHLGNKGEVDIEYFKVDTTPPTVEKTVGQPNIKCTEEDCDYWITQSTEISFTPTDGGEICHVDGVKCYYRYTVDGQPIVYFDDVESGTDDWTATGLWHITEYRSYSPTHSWAYNEESDHDYDTGSANSGELISKDIALGSKPILTFWSWEQVECIYGGSCYYDRREVYVSDDGGSNWNLVWQSFGPKEQWYQPVIDLSAYAGKTVKIKFRFDTVDKLFNNYEGWYVDDIKLYTDWIEYTGPFHFTEDSVHTLEYYCEDALGNKGQTQTEIDKVDNTPPNTTKTYGQPFFENDNGEWISSATPITLKAEDGGKICAVGEKETYYRVTQIEDSYCDKTSDSYCTKDGEGEWIIYTKPFTIDKTSCHVIEFKSVDKLGNEETFKKQCVYVDNEAPEPVKTVGKPRTEWDGKDAKYYDIADKCWSEDPEKYIECWKVTLFTPITLDCEDQEPHPVDHEKTCFKVEVDGVDKTNEYCNMVKGTLVEDGFCCGLTAPYEFHFNEETEHSLKYYCEDALGNKGPIDEEKFKVEGTSFNITLNKKWNLISVPFVMLDGSIKEAFKDIKDDVISVWTYDPEHKICGKDWCLYVPSNGIDEIGKMIPGWGYWVLTNKDTNLLIGGSLFSPATTPPDKSIVHGWNLIGYWGTEGQTGYYGPFGNGKPAYCELFSLGESFWDKGFASLVTYWEPYNPNQWINLGRYNNMDPGAGYWLFATEDGIYAFSTECSYAI